MLAAIVRSLVGAVRAVLSRLTDGPLSVTTDHALLRHSPPLVFYQGAETTVIFSSYGLSPSRPERTIFLQQRGWRTGLLGWSLGGYLGGTWSRGTNVTPERVAKWIDEGGEAITASGEVDALVAEQDEVPPPLPEARKRKLKAQVNRFQAPMGMKYLETLVVHVPSSSPDGYYRITLCNSPSHRPIVGSTTFRLYSSSLSTPSPRGANLFQLPAELVLSTLSASLFALILALFTIVFPFAKLASLMPGKWGKYLLRWAWGLLGGEEVERKVREHKTVRSAGQKVERIDRSVPWSRAGVRRRRDARDDEGRGGVALQL